jgi:hypothetical protein
VSARVQERLHCPAEFQDYLTHIFGVNHFGGPMFRIVWGQTETFQMAAADGSGYVEKLIGNGKPVWLLQRWMPPEAFGTTELYYRFTADPETGLALLGEYPDFGRYETMITFESKHYDPATNQLVIETIPLDWEIIERAIPLLMQSQELTYWQIRAALEEQERLEEQAIVAEIADRLSDSLPNFYGPVSYAGQANRTALIDRKKEQIERDWRKRGKALRQEPARGFFQKPN